MDGSEAGRILRTEAEAVSRLSVPMIAEAGWSQQNLREIAANL